MTAVWYRPLGTVAPGRHRGSEYHLWYRDRGDGHPETTSAGRTDWCNPVNSFEFDTIEDFLVSRVGYRVKEVGSMVPWDEDLDMDEGL